MKQICFEPRNEAPLYLQVCTLGIVLDEKETSFLDENGGLDNVLFWLNPEKYKKYQPYEARIGNQAVIILKGCRGDLQAAYMYFRIRDFIGCDSTVFGDIIPTYSSMLLSRVPKARNRLYVFVDQGLPPKKKYAGRMFAAYRLPDGVDVNSVWEVLMKQARGEWSSSKILMFRAFHGVIGHMAKQLSTIGGEKCEVKHLELPSFNYLLARYAFSATGHKLPRE